jgi:hypothetical protein
VASTEVLVTRLVRYRGDVSWLLGKKTDSAERFGEKVLE